MIRTSESVAAISAAWVAAAGEMPNVPKETKGQVGNAVRNYADLATVTETVRPILAQHGLAYIQGCSDGDRVVTVTTRLVHKSGEWIEDSLSMPAGNTAQTVGSAITYARRYSLMAVLGLAPDDDDGAAASKPPKATTKPTERPTAPKRPDVTETGELASEAQVKRIQIGLNGCGDRNTKLAIIADIIGHEIESSKNLTRREAGQVIDHIERQPA